MKILLMGQHFAPEDVSGAVLATELASDLHKLGHEVSFVTCAPNYPAGVVFPDYQNRLISKKTMAGVKVIRTWSYITPKKSFWLRILSFGTFSITAFLGGLVAGKQDLIISYSPPLTLGISAWLLSRLWNTPWVLRVEDLYPRVAVATGILKDKAVIALLEKLELFLYRKATHISLISASFRTDLIRRGIPATKLSITSVWADPDQIHPLNKDNGFRREHGLLDTFVVLYAGNLGHTSEFEDILHIAYQWRSDLSVRFVFVGTGVKKEELQKLASQLELQNVMFLPYQPRERYSEVLAAADVGLVTLNVNSAASSLPSKVFNIMASGRPVLAIALPQSDLAKLIRKYSCGIAVEPGNLDQLKQALIELKARSQQKSDLLGSNGRKALIEHFSRVMTIQKFEKLFKETILHGYQPVDSGSL